MKEGKLLEQVRESDFDGCHAVVLKHQCGKTDRLSISHSSSLY
jgi:hypothetical protein